MSTDLTGLFVLLLFFAFFTITYFVSAPYMSASKMKIKMLTKRSALSSFSKSQPPMEMHIPIYKIVSPWGRYGGVFTYLREAAKLQQLGRLAARKGQIQASLYTIDSVKLLILWAFRLNAPRGVPVGAPPVECYQREGDLSNEKSFVGASLILQRYLYSLGLM